MGGTIVTMVSPKVLAFSVTETLGLNALCRRQHIGEIRTLLYHNITLDKISADGAIPLAEFAKHIAHLVKHYNIVSLSQDGDWINYRSDRCNVLISFDDGFENNMHVLPILQSYAVSAAFFLVAACVVEGAPPKFMIERLGEAAAGARYRTIDIEGARRLVAAGMTVGSHSLDHRDHGLMTDEEAIASGRMAREMLESYLGLPVGLFAFPWGRHRGAQAAGLAGVYRRVFLTEHGFARPDDTILPRNEVANLQHLRVAASGALDIIKRLGAAPLAGQA